MDDNAIDNLLRKALQQSPGEVLRSHSYLRLQPQPDAMIPAASGAEKIKRTLGAFVAANGLQATLEALAGVAAERALEYEALLPEQKQTAKEWRRTARKLDELHSWCKQYGVGSNCK